MGDRGGLMKQEELFEMEHICTKEPRCNNLVTVKVRLTQGDEYTGTYCRVGVLGGVITDEPVVLECSHKDTSKG